MNLFTCWTDVFILIGIMIVGEGVRLNFIYINESFLLLFFTAFILETLKLEHPLFTLLFVLVLLFMFNIKIQSEGAGLKLIPGYVHLLSCILSTFISPWLFSNTVFTFILGARTTGLGIYKIFRKK